MIRKTLISKILGIGVLIVLLVIATGGTMVWAAGANGSAVEVTIEALGSVDYDTTTSTTTASTHAKFSDGKITIEADYLSYNSVSGAVTASGAVKVTRPEGMYQTEKMEFNVKTESGSTGPFNGVFLNQERNISIRGAGLELTRNGYRISGGAVTRCPEEKPHYTINAKKITFHDRQIEIQGAVLKIKGIPIFYLPRLTLGMDHQTQSFPVQFESGFNATDGAWLKGVYNHALSDNLLWYLSGKIVGNRVDSDHQAETGLSGHGALGQGVYNDTFFVNKKISGDYKLGDAFSYRGSLFAMDIDGYYDYSLGNKNEVGFSLTRNYWPTPIGNWQLGIQARRVEAFEGKPGEYGGVYGGYRLDYQPISDVTLSFLRLDDFNGKNNYGDFAPDLGSNFILSVGKTIRPNYRLEIAPSYNFGSQKIGGQINWKTCCYDSYIGWDTAKQAVNFGLSYHF